MCLDYVDEKPSCQFGIGYKVVEKKGRGYYSWDYGVMAGKVKYPVGKWLEDKHEGIIGRRDSEYPTGFHISLDRQKAECVAQPSVGLSQLKVFRCLFRRVVATGTQGCYGKIVVAREIMLIEEVKDET